MVSLDLMPPLTILHDIPLHLTAQQLLEELGSSPRPALTAAAEQAVVRAEALAVPMAVRGEFAVSGVSGGQVMLAAGSDPDRPVACLHVGSKADLLAPARQVVIAVYTIGPALEGEVRRLNTQDALLAYLLDSAGVLALAAVGEALRAQIEQQAAGQGWGVSPALGPGSLAGWHLAGQRELCALLPLEQIGVRLNEMCVLEPHKSVSMLVGLGPDYPSAHVGSVCVYCNLAAHCWRRRESLA
jgi:hypothetical protein